MPSCAHALSLSRRVTGETPQSSSITGWLRRCLNSAPMPNRVSWWMRLGEAIPAAIQRLGRQVEHRELHAARDVDADGVGDDRVVGGQHAADRQPVALVRVGHESPRHGDRQAAGVVHLLQRRGLDVGAPDPVADRVAAGCERAASLGLPVEGLRQGREVQVLEVLAGVGDHRADARADLAGTGAGCGEAGGAGERGLDRRPPRHAQRDDLLGLHAILRSAPRWRAHRGNPGLP